MKTVKQKMVAMTVAILLGTVGTTPAGAGISVGFGPGAAGGTYVGEMSDSDTEPSL